MARINLNSVILKPGKEKPILHRHHWIFSGAIAAYPSFENGDFLSVYSHSGTFLGSGYFNRASAISGRMISFDPTPPLEALRQRLDQAIAFRQNQFDSSVTTAYRLIHAEGDGIPGLIVDRYQDVLVMQISTLGMDRIRHWLVEYFVTKLNPLAIYEKSLLSVRQEEKLQPVQQLLYGMLPQEVVMQENGLHFAVSIIEGQKTGFFLDQREMRQWVRELAYGKRILNCFSYTGGFSVYGAAGGAIQVDSVDISSKAIEMAQKNFVLNGLPHTTENFVTADLFQFFRDCAQLEYDLVILDPPAFAKRQKDLISACRGYKDLNRIAMKGMKSGSMLLTCSCSYHVDETLFRQVLFQAATEAGRTVKIIGKHRIARDHPINIHHPEGDYLKSFLLYLD